jgi:S-(hydroxymethyl)glutathione dehydrogenase/alcohol dehydrogenase
MSRGYYSGYLTIWLLITMITNSELPEKAFKKIMKKGGKMKAALCRELGKPLVIEDGITVASPKKGEVLVKVDATAVCRSDLHVIEPGFPAKLPGLPGHETAGHVVEVGEGVNRLKVGDLVCVTTTTVGCGFCDACLSGNRSSCTTYPMMGPMQREPWLHTSKGEPISTMAGTVGGFAEYVLPYEYQCVKIADDMPVDRACILSCAVSTGVGSSITAGVHPFSSSLIIGTGAVGISAVQGSYFLGACPVIAMDVLDNRLEAAKKFGATHTINSKKVNDPIKAVKDLTEGKGADYVFITVTTSDNNLVRQAIEMSSLRGVIVKIAMGAMGPAAAQDIEWMRPLVGFGSWRRVISTAIGSADIIYLIPKYVSLYKAGRLKLDEYVSGHFPLEKINEAIAGLRSGEAIRNIIMM